jgi:hypothetical protein
MSSISFNITQSDTVLNNNISANSQLTMSIVNPLEGASYFTLETIPDNNGFYTSSTPKNLSGSFIVDSNTVGIVKDDYKMSAVVKPGTTNIVFTPAINVVGSTVKVRGVSGIQSTGPIFDADYQAVLNYAVTQGYTLPSPSQQIKQNQLVLDLKAGGIWSKLDTFANFATDGSSDFALIDWKRLSLYTAVNSPTFTTNQGFQGDGVGSYINTNFNPSTGGVNFANNNAAISLYVKIAPTLGLEISGEPNSVIRLRNSSSVLQRINAGSNAAANIDMSGTGVLTWNKNSSSNWTFYNNLTQSFNSSFVNIVSPNNNLLIFSFNGTTTFSNIQISIVAMGSSLDAENTNLNTHFNSYINSI